MLPSAGEIRKLPLDCHATVGSVSNQLGKMCNLGKAGANRKRGRRPKVGGFDGALFSWRGRVKEKEEAAVQEWSSKEWQEPKAKHGKQPEVDDENSVPGLNHLYMP